MWLWLMRIATQYQLMMSIVQSRQYGNASGATWWPKLKLMQVKIKEEEKVEKKLRQNWKKLGKSSKILPEAQRTQGIESETWLPLAMFFVEIWCTKAFSINLKVQNFDKFLPPENIERMRALEKLSIKKKQSAICLPIQICNKSANSWEDIER